MHTIRLDDGGPGGVGFDVSIMPDTCFEAFVFLEAARGAGGTLARSLPVSFAFEGYVDVDERGVTTSYSNVSADGCRPE